MFEPAMLPAAMDTQAGRIVVLQPRATVDDDPVTWTFDVCDNSWHRMTATFDPDAVDMTQLVYHAGVDVTLAIPVWEGAVWAYSLRDDTWTGVPSAPPRPESISDVVYDPDTRLVVGWSDQTSGLWTYDLGRGGWSEVTPEPGDRWPDTTMGMADATPGYTLMAYDTVRDAVLLAVLPVEGRRGGTWSFDVRAAKWTDLGSVPPGLLLGYVELGGEIAYDSAHGRAVVTAGGEVAVFDSSTGSWSRSSPDDWGDEVEFDTTWAPWTANGSTFLPNGLPSGLIARSGHTVVYDPAHQRVVMLGGSARITDPDMPADVQTNWWLTADTWAYDVGENSWTQLVPAQEPLVMSGTYRPTGPEPPG